MSDSSIFEEWCGMWSPASSDYPHEHGVTMATPWVSFLSLILGSYILILHVTHCRNKSEAQGCVCSMMMTWTTNSPQEHRSGPTRTAIMKFQLSFPQYLWHTKTDIPLNSLDAYGFVAVVTEKHRTLISEATHFLSPLDKLTLRRSSEFCVSEWQRQKQSLNIQSFGMSPPLFHLRSSQRGTSSWTEQPLIGKLFWGESCAGLWASLPQPSLICPWSASHKTVVPNLHLEECLLFVIV